MIIDSSAVIAVLKNEPDARSISAILERTPLSRMSAINFAEAGIVVDTNHNPVLSRRFDDLIRDVGIQVESLTLEQARIARQAYRDFGKGRHKAGLNLGDCFAYALAKATGEPLLFKGEDFRHTDLKPLIET